ncbi:MAG: cadmium-translocating P-type ATPase [Clostridia bacterium]|nr:cadmium-translocating P-type ATPase [Clostridia bacterium]
MIRFFKSLEDEHRKGLIRCLIAGILLVAAVITQKTVPVEERWINIIMYAVPFVFIGYDVIWEALKGIIHLELLDEHFLMVIASVGAFFIGEYPEAVAVMLFYQVGELLQDIAVDKSRDSVKSLMSIKPDCAHVLRDGNEVTVAPEEVAAGELIIVRPGERIPLDGVIVSGSTTLNTSALTGESLPKEVSESENVISGCVNLTGVITVKASGTYGESTVAKILEMTEKAEQNKARAEGIVRKFAKIYTPAVVVAAVLVAALPPLFFGQVFAEWLRRALMFLVVSCPCALVISVPLCFFCGIGAASRRGILIKGSNSIESLAKTGTVVFDKTGTLTKGSFSVEAVHTSVADPSELLDIAACAESYSDHPIASSIVRAHGGHIDKSRISSMNEITGKGIEAVIDGKKVLAGNASLVGCESLHCDECGENGTVVHVSVDGQYLGHIVIKDKIKPESPVAVAELKKLGVYKTVMLTGDVAASANEVAKEVGIDEIHDSLLPGDKADRVREMSGGKRKTVFVGDGINDAPAIVSADAGFAMGVSGSDAAIDTADVVIMDDNILKVPAAIKLSKRIMAAVRFNIWFSIAFKLAVMITGALGVTGMWLAVFGDVGVAVIAVMNALRLLLNGRKTGKAEDNQ